MERGNIMTEELYNDLESNNQIYVSDHLTPYFAKNFQLARLAKKNKKIFQVSSRGGKIRIKKTEHDAFEYIFSEFELNETINNESNMRTTTKTQNQSTHTNNKNDNNKSTAALRSHKRKADINATEANTNKKSKNITLKDDQKRQNKNNHK